MFIGNDTEFSSKELYGMIGKKIKNRDVELFVTACKGGASLEDRGLLPENTKIVTLSKQSESTYGSQVENLSEAVSSINGELTAMGLLKTYLAKCVKNRGATPQFAISDHQSIVDFDYLYDEALKAIKDIESKSHTESQKGLNYCNQLFKLEEKIKELTSEERYKKR